MVGVVKASKLLYVIAHPLDEKRSFSLSMSKEFIKTYKETSPEDEIIELNLFKEYIPEMDRDVLDGWGQLRTEGKFEELSNEQQTKISRINELADQFVEADKYVFVSPLWNFGLPARFKAYIDTFAIAGKTFKYTENGSVGLMAGKKAIHLQARGGIYSSGPAKGSEHGDSLLRTVLDLVGIELETIVAEGHAYLPDAAEDIKKEAIEKAVIAAKNFAKYLVLS
jgi:FMN-dependent NADH-azoreductase